MKKMRYIISFLLVLSMVTAATMHFTKDTAQAAGAITISDKTLTLEVDHYKTLRIKGTNSRASWRSSNSAVASVTANGKVFANTYGTTTITATVNGKKLTCKVSVIYLKKELTLETGKSYTLPLAGAKGQPVWSTNNEDVATVSDSGKVKAIAPGTATITARVDGKNLYSYITVVGINAKEFALDLSGDSGYAYNLKVTPALGRVKWSSGDKLVATVSSTGRVTAKGAGETTITATVNGKKITSKVHVLKMSKKNFTLSMGDTKKLKLYGTKDKIKWYSSKKSVATVSSNGTVTPVAPGKARIVAEIYDMEIEAVVTVVK